MPRSRYLPLCNYMSQKIGGSPMLWTIFNMMAAQGIGIGSHALLLSGVSQNFSPSDEFMMSATIIGQATGGLGAVIAIYLSDHALPRS